MNTPSENPYGTVEPNPNDQGGFAVYLYTELPGSCPRCEHVFSQALYRRLYPRKLRLHTKLFLVLLIIFGLVLYQFVGLAASVPVVIFGSWAMTWHKKVKVRCVPCGWSQTFIVSVRGYRK